MHPMECFTVPCHTRVSDFLRVRFFRGVPCRIGRRLGVCAADPSVLSLQACFRGTFFRRHASFSFLLQQRVRLRERRFQRIDHRRRLRCFYALLLQLLNSRIPFLSGCS